MSAFEIITEEEFEKRGASGLARSSTDRAQSQGERSEDGPVGNDGRTGAPQLTWCEFCEGYYIMANHFGDTGDATV